MSGSAKNTAAQRWTVIRGILLVIAVFTMHPPLSMSPMELRDLDLDLDLLSR